ELFAPNCAAETNTSPERERGVLEAGADVQSGEVRDGNLAPAGARVATLSLSGMSLIIVDGDTKGDVNSPNYKRVSFEYDFKAGDVISQRVVMGSACLPFLSNTDAGGERGCIPPWINFNLGSIENHSQTYALVRTQDISFCYDPANPTIAPA